MQSDELELADPCLELEAEFLAMAREYLQRGTPGEKARYQQALDDFPAFVRQLVEGARGVGLPPDRVPANTYWLVRGGAAIVATSSLRHWLTEPLKIEGGHIGYGVRPSERGKGYGRAVCALTIERACRRGLRRVLITCDADNLASAKVIRANGGVLEGQAVSPRTGKLVCRYWVDLSAAPREPRPPAAGARAGNG